MTLAPPWSHRQWDQKEANSFPDRAPAPKLCQILGKNYRSCTTMCTNFGGPACEEKLGMGGVRVGGAQKGVRGRGRAGQKQSVSQ